MAIAFDNAALNTTSFTCNGDVLIVTSNVTGTAFYNGVALTQAVTTSGSATSSIYYLLSPSVGTFSLTGTITGTSFAIASYSGVSGIGASSGANSGAGSVSSVANSLTTTQPNSWVVTTLSINSINPSSWSGTSQVTRVGTTVGATGHALYDTNGPVSVGTFAYTDSEVGGIGAGATTAVELIAKATAGFFNFM